MIELNDKISDKIIELMEMNMTSMEMTEELIGLKNDVKIKFSEYCRNGDPLDVSSKIKIPASEVIEYWNVFQTNRDIKDMVLMLIDINKPLKDEFERIICETILKSYTY